MTNITYYRYENGFQIESKGHAGYAPQGSDIVCAAVSTLTQTLLYRMSDLTINYNWKIGDGYMYVEAKGDASVMEAFDTILTGLKLITNEFPKYVKVYEKGYPIFNKNSSIS